VAYVKVYADATVDLANLPPAAPPGPVAQPAPQLAPPP
jgi:hypothetical protein